MAKYEAQIADLKNRLSQVTKVNILLPEKNTVDNLAAGLSLMLALKASGKEALVVTQDPLLVSQANLFGAGEVKSTLPADSGSNFVITLGGVVDNQGLVPALEKLDWYPNGQNLNLVFHVIPGQKFEPTSITPSSQGSQIALTICLGASNLTELGLVYGQNMQILEMAQKINIDNKSANSNFGVVNIIDPNLVSLSAIVTNIILGLNLSLDSEIATNLLNGLYSATTNLTTGVTADIFSVAATLVEVGGRLPASLPQEPVQVATPVQSAAPEYDLAKIFQTPTPAAVPLQTEVQAENFTNPPVVNSAPLDEVPIGEAAQSTTESQNPAPDWLVPKIYKGGLG